MHSYRYAILRHLKTTPEKCRYGIPSSQSPGLPSGSAPAYLHGCMKSTKVRRRPLRTGDLCSETALHRSARLRSFSELPFTSANTLGCVPTVETRPVIGRQTLFAAPAVFARPYHFRTSVVSQFNSQTGPRSTGRATFATLRVEPRLSLKMHLKVS